MSRVVGVVGLGQMGMPMASHLLQAGLHVVGYDIDSDRVAALTALGGQGAASSRRVAEEASEVITSLPSPAALRTALSGGDGLLAGSVRGLVIAETSTFSLEDKETARRQAQDAGALLLDCPLSGTAAQARTKDLVVYASGDRRAVRRCVPVFEGFARAHHYLGAFGAGSRMKFVTNLLVAIHNAAAAEAFVLGMKAGFEPEVVYDVIRNSAGTSRMFEVRGPMMAAGDYGQPGISGEVFQKDLKIISDFARAHESPVPLFAISSELHTAAVAQGHGHQDTAAVCAALERLAGHARGA